MYVININNNILFIIYLNFWNLPKLKIESKTFIGMESGISDQSSNSGLSLLQSLHTFWKDMKTSFLPTA